MESLHHSGGSHCLGTPSGGIAVVDLPGGEVLLNPRARALLNVSPGQTATAQDLNGLLNINLEDIYKTLLSKNRSPGGFLKYPFGLRREMTSACTCSSTSLMLPGQEDKPSRLLLVIRDETREREVDELSFRRRPESSMNCELRPLLLKNSPALSFRRRPESSQTKYLSIIKSNILRLGRLIENLLNFDKPDRSVIPAKAGIQLGLEIEPVIFAVIEVLEPSLSQKDMRLETDMLRNYPASSR